MPFFLSLSAVRLGFVALASLSAAGVAAEAWRVDTKRRRTGGICLPPEETAERAVYPYPGEVRISDDIGRGRTVLGRLYLAAGCQTALMLFLPASSPVRAWHLRKPLCRGTGLLRFSGI
ncbi:hypothetical protein [Geminisphaera colitermitum]|uniref:hypothetical protein n=1 Tax=Geminisphaera colitermitum TaxID=1148786 RepID=UPI0012FEB40A|nr:hypothetical protein [Geminisphaera colitermitum]